MLLGAFGISMLVVWEWNSKSKIHLFFHRFGVMLALLGPIAFGFQQKWNIFAIILMVYNGIWGASYLFLVFFFDQTNEDLSLVHKKSIALITTEALFLAGQYIAITAYVFESGHV